MESSEKMLLHPNHQGPLHISWKVLEDEGEQVQVTMVTVIIHLPNQIQHLLNVHCVSSMVLFSMVLSCELHNSSFPMSPSARPAQQRSEPCGASQGQETDIDILKVKIYFILI